MLDMKLQRKTPRKAPDQEAIVQRASHEGAHAKKLEQYGPSGDRARRYAQRSNDFKKELANIMTALKAKGPHARTIFNFIKWFHRQPMRSPSEITEQLKAVCREVRPSLKQYIAFVYRFRVTLVPALHENGTIELEPIYLPISEDWLMGQLLDGGLAPFDYEGDDEAGLDNLSKPPESAPEFLKRAKEKCQVRAAYLRVKDAHSAILRLIDDFYDPLSLNYIILGRMLFNEQEHAYLLCLIGELSSSADWKATQSFREGINKYFYDTSSRGRRADITTVAENTEALLRQGGHVDASVQDIMGSEPDEKRLKAKTESVRRTQKDLDKRGQRDRKIKLQ